MNRRTVVGRSVDRGSVGCYDADYATLASPAKRADQTSEEAEQRMKLEFGTTQLGAQPYLGIRTKATIDTLGGIMGPLFGEVYGYIRQSGQAPAGMPFAIYHSMEDDTVEVECAMPVASPMAGSARVQAGELPAGTLATVTHLGPYDGLRHTWLALTEWMHLQGFKAAGAPWEVYVTDPGAEPDQSKWRTDIFFPVR